jgi:hypothetical protein
MVTCILTVLVAFVVLIFAVPLLDISARAKMERRRAHCRAMATDPDYRQRVKRQRIMDWVVGPLFYLSLAILFFIYAILEG